MSELPSPFNLSPDALASEPLIDRARAGRVRHRFPQRRRLACGIAMAAADVAGFAFAVSLAATLADISGLGPAIAAAAGAMVGLHWLAGLYPGERLHPQEILRRRVAALAVSLLLGAALAAGSRGDVSAAADIGWLILGATVAQSLLRRMIRGLMHRVGLWGSPTAFLGDADIVPVLEDYFAANWGHGLVPARAGAGIAALDHLPTPAEALELHRHYSEIIVIADLPQLRVSGLNPIDLDGAIGLRLGEPARSRASVLKRALDISVAIPALLLTAPVILLAAAAIRIVDPGPAFYRQAREGYRGRSIRVLKLRTMYRDAEARLQDLLNADPAARAEWETHFKLRDDPRILPVVGGFLRASSFDELPQFLNVLAGEMSVVGPRPFPDYHLAAMPPDFRLKRCSVAPGITGLWQITARSDSDIAMQRQLDEHYIDNQSFWLDLRIVLGTFAALLGRKGAY